jgi:3-dehydroquinate dehydratase
MDILLIQGANMEWLGRRQPERSMGPHWPKISMKCSSRRRFGKVFSSKSDILI